jgi:hypothetical protein
MKQRAEKLLRRLEAEALISDYSRSALRTITVELDRSDSPNKFKYLAYANNYRVRTSFGYVSREVALQRIFEHEKNALYKIE